MDVAADMAIPPLFRCPISLDLFKDPVTLCTGQTYDRSCIEKWLSQRNSTCPVTMQRLDDPSIVPNHTLRHLIDNWMSSGGWSDPHCSQFGDIAAARRVLESGQSALEHNIWALETVNSLLLCQDIDMEINHSLIKMDFFGLIWRLVMRLHSELDSTLVQKALSCVLKLMPFSDLRGLISLKDESNFQEFLSLLEHGNASIKNSLCLIVEAISLSLETRDVYEMIGQSVKLMQEIIRLVNDKSEAAEAGIRAVSALSSLQSNHEHLVREGAIEMLIEYITNVQRQDNGSSAAISMSTIDNLISTEGVKEAILDHPNGIHTIVGMVFRVSDHAGSDSAVNVLVTLCSESRVAREKAMVEGVLVQLLLLLQSQCSGRTKAKAMVLLKMVRSRWIEDIH